MKTDKERTKLDNARPDPDKTKVRAKGRRSLANRAGGAMFWNIIFLPLKAVLGLLVSVFLVKTFQLNAYASLAAVTSIQTTLGLYSDLGIERALPRFVAEVELNAGTSRVAPLYLFAHLGQIRAADSFDCGFRDFCRPINRAFSAGGVGPFVSGSNLRHAGVGGDLRHLHPNSV